MEHCPLILLANEPAAYRSLLAAELPLLRPHLRVMEIPPAELETAIAALHPSVVVCSHTSDRSSGTDVALLLLQTEEIDAFLRTPEGTIVNPRLSDILQAIDRAISTRKPQRLAPLCAE